MTAIASHLPEPGSIAEMRDSALEERLRTPFSAEVKVGRDTLLTLETDSDGMVWLFVHTPGTHTTLILNRAKAEEFFMAGHRALEHIGGC